MNTMRIRHPNQINSGRTSNFPDLQSMLYADSTQNHNYDTGVNLKKEKEQSPNLPKINYSSSPRPEEVAEEIGGPYPRPEYLDPLGITKSEILCPSPLALLAKTCQNIGQMMETGPHPKGPSPNTTTRMLPTSGTTISYSGSISPQHNTIAMRNKNLNGYEQKASINGKRSTTHRPNWNPHEPDLSSLNKRHHSPISQPTNHTTNSSRYLAKSDQRHTSPVTPVNKCSPSSFPPSNRGSVHPEVSTINTSNGRNPHLTGLNDGPSSPTNHHTTSNALAQLARLSSSLALPDPVRPSGSQHLLDDCLTRDRFAWTETARPHSRSKRIRRHSGTRTHLSNTCSNIPRKLSRDERTFTGTLASATRSPAPGIQSSVTNAPVSTGFSNTVVPDSNYTEAWSSMYRLLQQALVQHEDHTGTGAQETFSYQLARSFLDFFYGKLTAAAQNAPSFTPLTGIAESHTFKDPRIHAPPASVSNSINSPQASSYPWDVLGTSSQSESAVRQCPLCGHMCSGQAELCVHLYSHWTNTEPDPTGSTRNNHALRETESSAWASRHDSAPVGSSTLLPTANDSPTLCRIPDLSSLHQINSYLTNLIARHKATEFVDSSPAPALAPLSQPNFVHTDSSTESVIKSLQDSRLRDKDIQSCWLRLFQHYCQTGLTENHLSQTPQFPISDLIPSSTSAVNNDLWSSFLYPPFKSTSPNLTAFPKV